jgi:hypothetical protein
MAMQKKEKIRGEAAGVAEAGVEERLDLGQQQSPWACFYYQVGGRGDA